MLFGCSVIIIHLFSLEKGDINRISLFYFPLFPSPFLPPHIHRGIFLRFNAFSPLHLTIHPRNTLFVHPTPHFCREKSRFSGNTTPHHPLLPYSLPFFLPFLALSYYSCPFTLLFLFNALILRFLWLFYSYPYLFPLLNLFNSA